MKLKFFFSKPVSKMMLAVCLLGAFVVMNTNVIQAETANVSDYNSFRTALGKKTTDKINITNDFSLRGSLTYYGSKLEINGNNKRIDFGSYKVGFNGLRANIVVKDLSVQTSGAATGKAFYSPCKANITFENINFTGSNMMHSGCGSIATFSNINFKGYRMNNDTSGETIIKNKITADASYKFVTGKNITFDSSADVNAKAKESIFYIACSGKLTFMANAKAIFNSEKYGAYLGGSKSVIDVREGADVTFNTANTFNGHTCDFDKILVAKNAKLNITNWAAPHKKWTVGVRSLVDVATGGSLVIVNRDPKIRCHPVSTTSPTLAITLARGTINVAKGAEFGLSQNQSKNALQIKSKGTLNFNTAKVEGWRPGTNLNGAATDSYSNVSGYIAVEGSKQKGQTNDKDFNSKWGQNGATTTPYSQIWINKGGSAEAAPIISVLKNEITYEKSSSVSEAKFLADIGAKSTYDKTPITSNFTTIVKLDTVGTYNVTLNQKTLTGVTATPVNVKVHIKDSTLIIYHDDYHVYNTAGEKVSKTEAEFLKDINARTNDGTQITSNFHDSILNTVGSYKITLNAKNAVNEVIKEVITIVIHKNKSIEGKYSTLYADSFTFPLRDAYKLTRDSIMSKNNADVSAYEYITGNSILDQVEIKDSEFKAIVGSRAPGKYNLTFTLNYKNGANVETLTRTIEVVLED